MSWLPALVVIALGVWLQEAPSEARWWRALTAWSVSKDDASEAALLGHLLAHIPPDQLERELTGSPERWAPLRELLSEGLSVEPVANYVAAVARSRSNRLAREGGRWSEEELESILTLQLVDPQRFVGDARFRSAVLEVLPRAIGDAAPRSLRDALLFSINNVPGIDFEASEAIEWGWAAIARPSAPRERAFDSGNFAFAERATDPIVASVYSLPSSVLDAHEAVTFLEQIRQLAPARDVVVLVDLPLRLEIEESARRLNVHLVETHGRRYSAWPRDPFSLVRASDGSVVVLVRPNSQRGRGEDNFLGRELIQGLPESLDRAWGTVHWTRSPVPFHNGQVLLTKREAWLSLHSLEPHVLDRLGLERVPVDDFDTSEGWLRYARAVRRVADELSAFYGRDVAFVHELDEPSDSSERSEWIAALAAGAGFDLDSLVTMLEARDGTMHALVGDVDLGGELVNHVSPTELAELGRTFRFEPGGAELRRALAAAQTRARARGLDAFLELVSRSLMQQGVTVARVPLFFVPVSLLQNRAELHHEDFLITWNNVVLERRGGSLHAEGFSQGLPTGDDRASEAFRAVGYELDLVSPLTRSIVLGGGYRCASQHLR